MMILFVKNIGIEGPETLGRFFDGQGFATRTIDLQKGDTFPDNVEALEAVAVLGGPMNVYEEGRYPFLRDEGRFIKQIVSKEIPFMGICLGSQLLAKACGAKVVTSPEKEIGFLPVRITKQGLDDPLFEGLQESIDVFHWHEDMSELPNEATLLASSKGCPHQAFKAGPCAYGLQFHMEVTEPVIRKWAGAYFDKSNFSKKREEQTILGDYRQKNERFHQIAGIIYNNFLKIIYNKKSCVQ